MALREDGCLYATFVRHTCPLRLLPVACEGTNAAAIVVDP